MGECNMQQPLQQKRCQSVREGNNHRFGCQQCHMVASMMNEQEAVQDRRCIKTPP